MTTIRLKSRLPVRTNEEDARAHCQAFGLTYKAWAKGEHRLNITVEETVTLEQQQAMAAVINQQLLDTLITVAEDDGETFNLG